MKTVFVDVDTQIDFVYPAGALYAAGAETIVPALVRLNRHAAASGIPVISTMDAHAENDPEFRNWPAHCVAGTIGQQKVPGTMLENFIIIPTADTAERIDTVQQIILEKVHTDVFRTPNLPWVLEALNADRYIVYGVVTEICVALAAFGLLKTGKRVELVRDAVRSLSGDAEREMLDRFQREGGALTTTEAALAGWVS